MSIAARHFFNFWGDPDQEPVPDCEAATARRTHTATSITGPTRDKGEHCISPEFVMM
jgi:hypothetical protein